MLLAESAARVTYSLQVLAGRRPSLLGRAPPKTARSAHCVRPPGPEGSRAPRRRGPEVTSFRPGSLDLERDAHGVVDLAPFDVADGSPISGHVPFDSGTGGQHARREDPREVLLVPVRLQPGRIGVQ